MRSGPRGPPSSWYCAATAGPSTSCASWPSPCGTAWVRGWSLSAPRTRGRPTSWSRCPGTSSPEACPPRSSWAPVPPSSVAAAAASTSSPSAVAPRRASSTPRSRPFAAAPYRRSKGPGDRGGIQLQSRSRPGARPRRPAHRGGHRRARRQYGPPAHRPGCDGGLEGGAHGTGWRAQRGRDRRRPPNLLVRGRGGRGGTCPWVRRRGHPAGLAGLPGGYGDCRMKKVVLGFVILVLLAGGFVVINVRSYLSATHGTPGGSAVKFTVHPGDSLSTLGPSLRSAGVIDSPRDFKIWLRLSGDSLSLQRGDYDLRRHMPYREIVATLARGPVVVSEGLLLREGLTVT